ncbi:MAG: response regulator [Oscillospiraceae bacterium]|nr:response regulator [Oscillospiraceae bacterium]
MHKKIPFTQKINFRILAMLLVLFAITAVGASWINQSNIKNLYEEVYTERVLLTNALMAAIIDSEDVEYFVELMKSQDERFKQKQIRFWLDREEYWELQEKGADEEDQQALLENLAVFHSELANLKTEKYWDIIAELKHLKEISNSTYLYVMADTGLVSDNGERLYTFIFDAEDEDIYGSIDIDGLGTCDISQDTILEVYETKKQMEWVYYYTGGYGELYYAYAPILNKNGDVIAILGTDLDLAAMNNSIGASTLLFNTIFLAFFVIILISIFIFLRRSITKPLSSLTNTARELAQGNVYSPASETALKQRGEIGMLANAINDMNFTYQNMISSTGKLLDASTAGKLDVRNDADKFKGDIKKVLKQINATLDSMILYLNNIPESIFIMSKELDTYFKNGKFASYFSGISALEFISEIFPQETNDKLSPQDRQEYLKEQVSDVLKQDNSNMTVRINDLCFSIIFKEIVSPNELIENSILVIAVDITDLTNEKENAHAAAKAKSDFLSRMSHEMRTPMNAIIGMTKISETTDDVLKLKHCLSTIATSSGHLLGIINDVLDMAKIEAGKFELENVPMNIEKMLMKVCNIVVDNMEKKNLKFNVILSRNLNLNYIADDLRLSQVITNLLSNSVKFTPEGGKITLSVEKIENIKNTDTAGQNENISTLRFSVSDTGIGLSKEQIARLFNAFEQADGGVSRKYGGTGLGLAISQSIVEKMKGRIWAESEPGIGSTFIFEANLENASHQDTVIFDGIRPEDIRLLIVENDDDIRERFLHITESFGINADLSANINETIAFIEAACDTGREYDIVFLDYDMPGADAMDFINQINGKINKNTVIIISTYLEWNRIEKFAFENNITRYITKPVFPSSVLDAINTVVGKTLKSLDIKTETTGKVPDLSGVSIILAEDVEINREIFISLLEDTRISIDIAENGLIATEKFKKNPDKYNIIVMDIQMPEMDGYQATKTIRSLDIPRAKSIPIIAMTANAFREDIERCLEAGMDDHLSKPIDIEQLYTTLIKWGNL